MEEKLNKVKPFGAANSFQGACWSFASGMGKKSRAASQGAKNLFESEDRFDRYLC